MPTELDANLIIAELHVRIAAAEKPVTGGTVREREAQGHQRRGRLKAYKSLLEWVQAEAKAPEWEVMVESTGARHHVWRRRLSGGDWEHITWHDSIDAAKRIAAAWEKAAT